MLFRQPRCFSLPSISPSMQSRMFLLSAIGPAVPAATILLLFFIPPRRLSAKIPAVDEWSAAVNFLQNSKNSGNSPNRAQIEAFATAWGWSRTTTLRRNFAADLLQMHPRPTTGSTHYCIYGTSWHRAGGHRSQPWLCWSDIGIGERQLHDGCSRSRSL